MNSHEKRLETNIGAAKKRLQAHIRKNGEACYCLKCKEDWEIIRTISEMMNNTKR